MRKYPIDAIREAFPGLKRSTGGRNAIFFDGPGGSQVPNSVAKAVSNYLIHHNANTGMSFETSLETDRIISESLQACSDLLLSLIHI